MVWLKWGPGQSSETPEAFPLPAYSESRFLNTGPEAHFVGVDVCAGCHASKHRSYLLTAHSQALADLDPATEPPDGSFQHQPSGGFYRVYRKDGQLRHEEVFRTAEGKEIARLDLPLRYRIGSGHFARTYLIEVDGFLHESPITWYAAKKQWGMSPGYDTADHVSFERPVKAACLVCHAGRVETAGAVHRPTLHEKVIGCESCHGPGSEHVALRKSGKAVAGTEDLTIVNPGTLPRPRLESVCASCHLSAAASIYLRGRQVTAFRPGMPLTDYRIDYRFDSGSEQMTVVGHMEQLRQSACYQKSKDLTCLTCHDPHASEKPKDLTAFHRQHCLSCHTVQSCRLDHAQRVTKDATDNCVACHMPRSDTDIPHLAFTHHRIGLHTAKPSSAAQRTPDLVPIDNVSHLSAVDQQRNLGLAYLQASRKLEYGQYASAFVYRARKLLEAVDAAGLHDADTAGALADLYLSTDLVRSKLYAQQALDAKDASAEVRANALILLASCEMKLHNYQAAIELLKQLVPLRRNSEDWVMLGMCQVLQNQPQEALVSLQKAQSIRPDNQPLHAELAKVYGLLGDAARSDENQAKAQWLSKHRSN
jgi:predicted CXXCH cytochrome family protein